MSEELYPYTYTLYGLHIQSNEPLPLLPAQAGQSPTLTITFAPESPRPTIDKATVLYAYPYVNAQGEHLMSVLQLAEAEEATYCLHAWTGDYWVDCVLPQDGKSVQVIGEKGKPYQDLIPCLLGMGLPLVLRLQGVTCLHASAVLVDGGIVAFTGPSEAGKSTTMGALLQHGATFFSDDLVPFASEANDSSASITSASITSAYPGYPRLGLVEDAMTALFGPTADLPYIERSSKRFYTPEMTHVGTHPWPLRAIYSLSPRGKDPTLSQPVIVPLSQGEAVAELMPHTTGRTLRTAPGHARDLARIATLARTIPVRRIDRPNDLSQLDAVAKAILHDVSHLPK